MENQITFRAEQKLLDQVLARTNAESRSEIARRDLSRYYRLLEGAMPELSEAEFSFLCDLCNGTFFGEFELSPSKTLLVELQDGAYLASKWGVDYGQLLAKVQRWADWEASAVVDRMERFWRGQ